MDYENKYNEALERARNLMEQVRNNELLGFPDQFTEIFPELRENEDERVRKVIVKYFKELHEQLWINLEIPDILTWLEKQKEQKPVEWEDIKDKVNIPYCSSEPEWSEEDSKRYISIGTTLETSVVLSKEDYDANMSWLRNLVYSQKYSRPKPQEEIYQAAKHDLAIKFMNYLDENRPEGKMGLSNGECEDIDKAFKENDWAKILIYAVKYGK